MSTTVTALEIALATGKSKRAVLDKLKGIKPSGNKLVRGQLADAWEIKAFPEALSSTLARRAKSRGYRDTINMLATPPQRWKPAIPMAEIAEHHLAKAMRLRDALRSETIQASASVRNVLGISRVSSRALRSGTGDGCSLGRLNAMPGKRVLTI